MTPAERRNERGQFTSEHSITTNKVFEAMDQLEPYTTAELADSLDAPRRTVYKYLEELHDEGRVRKKKLNQRRVIWIRGS